MTTFDTLTASRELQAAGFEQEQANAIVDTMRGAFTDQVASKADIAALRTDMQAIEQRLIIRLGGLLFAGLGLLFAALKLTA